MTNSKNPKVSLIIVSLNFGEFIEHTIKAALNQDYPNREVIVVDGGSTDKTLEVLKKFDKRIKWISEPDEGQGDACLKGLKMATGDIAYFQPADDLLYKSAATQVVKAFKENPKAAGIYGRYTYIDEKGKDLSALEAGQSIGKQLDKKRDKVGKIYKILQKIKSAIIPQKSKAESPENPSQHLYSFRDLITRKIVLPACATFFKKETFDNTDFGDLKSIKLCPDYRMWLGLGLQGEFVSIPGKVCKTRKQPEGGNINPKNIGKIQASYRKSAQWFFSNPKVPKEYKTRKIQQQLESMILLRAPEVWSNISFKKAVSEYFKIAIKHPKVIWHWPRRFRNYLELAIKYYLP